MPEKDRAVEKIIVPILTYVEKTLVEAQIRCGVNPAGPMDREAGSEEGEQAAEEVRGVKDEALDYLRRVLFRFSSREPRVAGGRRDGQQPAAAGDGYGDERTIRTIKGFWEHLANPKKKLPALTPYLNSISDIRGQYVKDLLQRALTLAEDKPEPYAKVAGLIEDAVDDRLRNYLKPDDDRPLVPERLVGKLRELAAARGEHANASLLSCIRALVYVDAEDPCTVEAALPLPDIPLLVGKEVADKVWSALKKSLDADGTHPVVLVTGEIGSGRATAMARAISRCLEERGVAHAFWYRFDSSLRKTVCSAVLGRNGNTDEAERFDQTVQALSTLAKTGTGRTLIALVDVGREALESGLADLVRVARTGAVVMMTVTGNVEMNRLDGLGHVTVVEVGVMSRKVLIALGEANAARASRELWPLGFSDASGLVECCGANAGLMALASACAGREGSAESVNEALRESSGPVEGATHVLRVYTHDNPVIAALALLPPEGAGVRIVRALVGGDVPLLLRLLDVGAIMRDAVTGRIMLNGALAEGAVGIIAEKELAGHPSPSGTALGKAADRLWSDVLTVNTWSTLEEAMACYERLLGLLEGREEAWVELCRARLARLYEKTNRTWLAMLTHGDVLERLEEAYREDEVMHDAGGALIELLCPDREASLAEEYLRLGHTQMQYALRAESVETLDRGICILEQCEPTRARSALLARLLREKGWCLHEKWKRDGGEPDDLRAAIEAKRKALLVLDGLEDPPATGLELQNVHSTLGYSLVESQNESDKVNAVEYARRGLCELYEYITNRKGEGAVENPARAAELVKTHRRQFAEALYFYGRILAGGEHPDGLRKGEPDEEREERLERALIFERTALQIREKLEPEKWNMGRALNLASIGMVEWCLGREDEARRDLRNAMEIQDHRTHVTDEFGERTGQPREAGPITDWFYKAFPAERAADM